MSWKLLTRPVLGGRTEPQLPLLVAIVAAGTMAMHMFIPALPAAAADLATSPGTIQLTITLYIVGLAFGQLLYGPISDRYGRRPVLLAAFTLYLAATVGAWVAQSVGELILARVAQAIGGCGGLVIGRAMLRDSAPADDAARSMALLSMCVSISPAVAPAIGGFVSGAGGWRAVFALLSVLALLLLVLCVLILPETHRGERRSASVRSMLASYKHLLRQRNFVGWAVGGASTTTSLYAFLASSPFIFQNLLGRSPQEVGLYYVLLVGGVATGSFVAARLAGRVPLRRAAQTASAMQIAAMVGMLAADRLGYLSVATLLVPMTIHALGCGIASPFATTGAISVDQRMIGAAAGLYGFIQMMFGAICTAAVGLWHTDSALPVSVVLLTATVIGQLGFASVRIPRTHPH
jgi:DHA1 family bicyclomycin/chloramphenicol resistance-like MFS transporter